MITLSENFRALFYAPFYAAHEIGAFKAECVEVAHRDTASPGEAMADLLAGRTDVMWGGPLRVLLTHQAEPSSDIVCFCDVVARDPFFVIGREPRPGFSVRDLAGIRFGSVSEVPTPWLCLQDDLRRAGVDPAGLNRVAGASMADNVLSLREGRLDAVQLFQPYAEALLASGDGHVWYAAADRGLTAYTTLVTRRATIAARREELGAMVRALYRALSWIRGTEGAEVARVLALYFPDVPPSLFASAIDRYRGLQLYGPDPVTRREGFDRLAAAMLSGGALKALIPFEECVDNSLAEAAVA
jgi:NitT/TauT family transport system substrate-binding protein